jgi:hypothetical protein
VARRLTATLATLSASRATQAAHSEALSSPESTEFDSRYQRDARNDAWLALGLFVLALASLGVATAGARWCVAVAGEADADRIWAWLAGPLSVVLIAASLMLFLLRHAMKRLNDSRESRRLQRTQEALDAYLRPLPPTARHLLRCTLAPFVFPRPTEDSDPLWQPDWPNPAAILNALDADSTGQA